MARLYPDDYLDTYSTEIYSSEFETLERLKAGLSDQYEIFHGVHWSNLKGKAIYGEIDFLILHPNGRLLAIEQKNIELEFRHGDLIARYGTTQEEKVVTSQIVRNISNLRSKFSDIHPHLALQIDHILYLPTSNYSAAVPINVGRIVDSSNANRLPEIIREILEAFTDSMPKNLALHEDIHRFLMSQLKLIPNVGVLSQQVKEVSFNLSRGLTDWVHRLEFSPFRLHIQGTAGSGKTQLALKELSLANEKNLYGLYLCFNRPLVDSIKKFAPNPQFCFTFHELAKNIADLLSLPVNLLSSQAFLELEMIFAKHAGQLANEFDYLIIDEGQDFKVEWRDLICQMVKPDGRIIWMEDVGQTIYPERYTNEWGSWVNFKLPINFRSPKLIVDLINELQLTSEEIVSGSPMIGELTGLRTYQKLEKGALFKATQIEVQNLLNNGYDAANIAVVTFCGANRSEILNSNQMHIANKPIKKLIGYSPENQPIWSNGDVLIDTIYRFKGLSADAVVITEVDFTSWSTHEKNKLFVALTRARLKVVIVASEEATNLIEEQLN
jgi:hypothetical protein